LVYRKANESKFSRVRQSDHPLAGVIPGIHHVTAIAGDPQGIIEFYTGILGLRLIKLTVNYDDPTTYHLYFGDETGHPGTILTFFPWPGAPKGLKGSGQAVVTSFSIPEKAIGYWTSRLRAHGVEPRGPVGRFEEKVVSFSDPDGLSLELVASADSSKGKAWERGPVPSEYAIQGFHHVTLSERESKATERLLTETMGFRASGQHGDTLRFETSDGGPGAIVDILVQPSLPRGFISVGTVHHVAWRTPNDEEQKAWRAVLAETGLNVTPVIDRKYFHSIYYREPGGVLFEIATEPPGFTVDQPAGELGARLMLPPWLEPTRKEIESHLPRVSLPKPVPAH
jgi:glyoxalase family protein